LDTLENIIWMKKFDFNKSEEFKLGEDTTWIKAILVELEEQLEHEKEETFESSIETSLKITRKTNSMLKEHFIVSGHLEASFMVSCVRCLENTAQHISKDFHACFIDNSLEKEPEYEDALSVYCEGKEMDLYFFENGKVNLGQLIHEQIFVEKEDLPLHDENCQGLCPTCGVNLNEEKCPH